MKGFTEFEFDLATPLFEQIRECLDRVEAAPLTQENLDTGIDGSGVYILLKDGVPVYVGKAGSSVLSRLRKHLRTISGRQNISPEDVQFKSATFASTWNPFLPENHLISHYGTAKGSGWNGRGFGANEPGKERYTTGYKKSHFFTRYPLNEHLVCDWLMAGVYDARGLAQLLKENLPFWFKIHVGEETTLPPAGVDVRINRDQPTAIEAVVAIGKSLGKGWRVVKIPSHLLLEYDRDFKYPSMTTYYPKGSSRPAT